MASAQNHLSISELIRRQAADRPGHIVIEHGDIHRDYLWLEQRATGLAAALQALGIGKGDVVAFQLPNHPDQCALLLAIAMVGGTSLPLRLDGGMRDIRYAISGVSPALLVLETDRESEASKISVPEMQVVTLEALSNLSESGRFRPPPGATADDPFRIAMTSGTTGSPKYFVYDQAVSLDRIRLYQAIHGWSAGERFYLNMPMGDPWGACISLAMMAIGGTIVMPSGEDRDELETIHRQGITTLVLLPWFLRKTLTREPSGEVLLPRVRSLLCSGSRLGATELRAIRERISPNLYHIYGTTEVFYITLQGPGFDAPEPGCLGQVARGVELQVVTEEGRPLPTGETGLIRCRRSRMPGAYINNPEATQRHFRDGWFYPLDMGRLDGRGFLFYAGRADDMINTRDAKYYPLEIENLLEELPSIEEAIVFGWPDDAWGEVAAAAFVAPAAPDPADLDRHCRARLPDYQVPRYYLRVASIPRNRNGKVEITALKARLSASLERRVAPS